MRKLLALMALLFVPGTALAQTDFSAGLTQMRSELEAKADPSDEDRFVLGGTIVLQTFETAFQERWRVGNTNQASPFPILRIALPNNPAPEPFEAQTVAGIFEDVIAGMAEARAQLEKIPQGSGFGAEVDLSKIWFDINTSGAMDPQETMFNLGRMALQTRNTPQNTTVRFDRSDVDWLIAYTHIFSGVAELLLAFNPTEVIAELLAAEAEIKELHGDGIDYIGAFMMGREWVTGTAIAMAMEQQPDAVRTEAARQHFLAMVQANRRVWQMVPAETDNDREWIPSDTQTHAFGVPFPPGLGQQWIDVLTEMEDVIEGRVLLPFWRGSGQVGINLKRLLQEPPEINLIGWIHGIDAIPYMERGEVASGAAWWRFRQLVGPRNAVFFALALN